MMPVLTRKMLRDLWRLRGQLAAIGLVLACGITIFVMFLGMIRSLEETRDAYYDRSRFADLFAEARRVPRTLEPRLRRIDGVAAVETRIVGAGLLDVPRFDEPVTAQLQSIPERGRPQLNDLTLVTGRWPDPARTGEVLVSLAFAEAHELTPGDRLGATLHGVRQPLTIAGVALSPEFVYAFAPGRIMPDDKRFAVIWMPRRQLEAAFDLDGAFNSLSLTLRRDARPQQVIDAVDRLLERYGGTGAYVRADQMSERFLSAELDQLNTLVRILPPVFLGVAAFLLNIVIGRLVATEREIIGLMKAYGYSTTRIIGHYLSLVMAVVVLAILLGSAVGTWLGRELAELYTNYYRFPFLYFRAGVGPYLVSGSVAAVAGALAAVTAVSRIAGLSPAAAMRPPAPMDYSRGLAGVLIDARFLDETSRMVLRHLLRNPGRAALTVLGIAAAMALLTGSRSNIDSVEKMMHVTFNEKERQDMTVTFVEPRSRAVLHELALLPGVLAVEPFRAVPAILQAGPVEQREALMGVVDAPRLNRLLDRTGEAVPPPERGLILSAALADSLKVGPGDLVDARIQDGARPRVRLSVTGVVEAYVGTPAFLHIAELNAVMGEGPNLSGAYLSVDAARADTLFRRLKDLPGVAGVEMTQAAFTTFEETMDQTIGITTGINTIFSSLIIFGVVYNAARISLAERGRELASMRVLGFSRAQVSFVLLGELVVLVLLALPLGAALGALLSYSIIQSFSSDLFIMPFALQPSTIATAALITVAAAALSGLLVRRRIDTLNLIDVLKTRE